MASPEDIDYSQERFQEPATVELNQELQEMADRAGATPEAKTEPVFEPGQQVAVLRSDGQIEYDWEVEGQTLDGNVVVVKYLQDTTLSKMYTAAELARLQPVFHFGQAVVVSKGDGVEPGWKVYYQGSNGNVMISQPVPGSDDASRIKKVSAAKLHTWQPPLTPAAKRRFSLRREG